MKRFLSWIVMCLISVVVSLIASLLVGLGGWLIGIISHLSVFLQILCYLVGGSTLLSLIFLPVFYGPPLTVMASEAVCPTKKGTRYKAYAILMLITYILDIIIGLNNGHFNLATIVMCIYYIVLLISSKEFADA